MPSLLITHVAHTCHQQTAASICFNWL